MAQQPILPADAPAKKPAARGSLLAVAALVALAAIVGCNKVWDSDVWWHLASGQWMLDHHAVLGHDPFSINPPEKWINVHWLFQVLAAGLYRLGGFDALVGFKMAGLATVIGGMALWLRRRIQPAWLMLIGTLVILGLEDRVRARPETLTFFFFAATLVIVESVLRGASPRRLWWLVPINILWVNSHGLFFLGLAILWAAWAGVGFDRFLEREDAPRISVRAALIPSLAATLACLVSPWPLEAALHPLLLSSRISGGIYTFVVSELTPGWQVRPWDHPPVIPVWVLAAMALISLRGRKRPPTAHFFWLALFLILALMAMRNLPLLAIVAGLLSAIDWPWWNVSGAAGAGLSCRCRTAWKGCAIRAPNQRRNLCAKNFRRRGELQQANGLDGRRRDSYAGCRGRIHN